MGYGTVCTHVELGKATKCCQSKRLVSICLEYYDPVHVGPDHLKRGLGINTQLYGSMLNPIPV